MISVITRLRGCLVPVIVAVSLAAWHAESAGQDRFPSKPVRIIVPYGPGGALDLISRIVGDGLSKAWGQAVVVENRAGGVGVIGIGDVVKSAPDGYTLLSVPATNLVINPHLYSKLPYDPFKDLAPITLLITVPNVLVVGADVPAKSLKDLIELARAKPGTLSYSSPGVGSQAHLAGEYLNSSASIDLLHVPFNSIGQALTSVLSGQVTMMFAQMQAALPYVQSGKLRALAIASPARSPLMPTVPTVVESGLPEFEAVTWNALMAPAGTPKEVITKIQSDVSKILHAPELKEKLASLGAEPGGGTPEELEALMRADTTRYGNLIHRLHIKIE